MVIPRVWKRFVKLLFSFVAIVVYVTVKPGGRASIYDSLGNPSADSGVKTILYWNPWYSWDDYQFGFGRDPFVQNHCPVDRCQTTNNLSQFATADAVVFFARSLKYLAPIVVPRRLKSDQVYVFFNMESPYKRLGHYDVLNGIFNMTVSYRLDSDIPMPHYEILPTKGHAPAARDVRQKSGLVTWLVSHCAKGKGMRIAYARQLSEHVSVDIYGECGPYDCPSPDTHECMLHLERKYKFYLAFENSVCADYVTEKAFRTLQYNLVPIVWGGANYTRQLPPHSFIDVRDFASPGHLAAYLQHLDWHPEEYLRYFEWKKHYRIQEFPVHRVFCRMCEMLHSGRHRRSGLDIGQWWDRDAHCVLNKDLPEYFRFEDPELTDDKE